MDKIKSLISKNIKPTQDKQIASVPPEETAKIMNEKTPIKITKISDENKFKVTAVDKPESERSGDFDWFTDRYQSLLVQRNFCIALVILTIIAIFTSTISLAIVSKAKTIEPFVIEIEKASGIVAAHNTSDIKSFSTNDLVRNYFIKKYLEARELYDPNNFAFFYYKTTRYMSSDEVYKQFNRTLYSTDNSNPKNLLANNVWSELRIISINQLKSDTKTLSIRFEIKANFSDGRTLRKVRVVYLDYDYYSRPLTEEVRYINPLGFVVTSYRITDEVQS